MEKIICTLLLCASCFFAFPQNLTYGKSTLYKEDVAGNMVSPDVNFSNTGSDSIEIFVRRYYKNLPPNWTSCFCFINCHNPSEDTLRFWLHSGEAAMISVGFNTDTIPGIGYVSITIEQIGGTQKDTLHFTGSTLVSGIKENYQPDEIKFCPNPTPDKLIIKFATAAMRSVQVKDISGKAVMEIQNVRAKYQVLDLRDHPKGLYFITVTDQDGILKTERIIKE